MAYYHCLLLDVDGTMMDFAAAEHKAFHETMSEFGLPATDEVEHTYHTINKGLWAALEKGKSSGRSWWSAALRNCWRRWEPPATRRG